MAEDSFFDFLEEQWDVLTQPEHEDFWVAMRLLEKGVGMLGAYAHANALSLARERKRMDADSEAILVFLHQRFRASRPLFRPGRILELMESSLREARTAFDRGDVSGLVALLQSQAALLSEHGYMVEQRP